MKNSICLVILLFYWIGALGQQKYLDSLLRQLEGHPQEDTIKVNLLNEISYTYSDIDPEKGISIAKEAISLAEKLRYLSQLAVSYNHLGVNYNSLGKDTLALEVMEKSLALYKEADNRLGMARLFNNLALVYYNFSDYGTALQYHEEASAIFKELDNRYALAHSYNNTGVVHLAWADYPRALDAFLDAHRVASLTASTMMGNILSNIGLVYKNLKEYGKAREYQEEALLLYRAMGNQPGTARALGNLAALYDLTGNPEKSVVYYQEALAINKKVGDSRRIAADYTNLGVVFSGMSDYPSALDHLLQGLEYYGQTTDKANTSLALLELAYVLDEATDSVIKQKGFDPLIRDKKVLEYQHQALKLAEESESLLQQQNAWAALSETYEASASTQKAFEAYKKYIQLRDSVFNKEKERELVQKQAQFDYEKKEALLTAGFAQEQALNLMELSRQRIIKNSIAGGMVFFFLAVIGAYVSYKKRRDAEEKQKESEFYALVAEVEMKALRAQMNPHFIFNSLNSISDFILKNDLRTADYYLAKFAKLMRMILENSEQKEIPLDDDLHILGIYMELEALRMGKKFSYEIQIDKCLNAEAILVPPLLLQPFVENSIWHGFSKLEGDGKISIQVKKEMDMIHFIIEDNGIGRKESATTEKIGAEKGKVSMGIRITQDRIHIINRIKKANAALVLSDLQRGLRIDLKLPLSLNF